MNKWIGILAGLILLVAAVYVAGKDLYGFGLAALAVLKGGLIWAAAGLGFLFLISGISGLKN